MAKNNPFKKLLLATFLATAGMATIATEGCKKTETVKPVEPGKTEPGQTAPTVSNEYQRDVMSVEKGTLSSSAVRLESKEKLLIADATGNGKIELLHPENGTVTITNNVAYFKANTGPASTATVTTADTVNAQNAYFRYTTVESTTNTTANTIVNKYNQVYSILKKDATVSIPANGVSSMTPAQFAANIKAGNLKITTFGVNPNPDTSTPGTETPGTGTPGTGTPGTGTGTTKPDSVFVYTAGNGIASTINAGHNKMSVIDFGKGTGTLYSYEPATTGDTEITPHNFSNANATANTSNNYVVSYNLTNVLPAGTTPTKAHMKDYAYIELKSASNKNSAGQPIVQIERVFIVNMGTVGSTSISVSSSTPFTANEKSMTFVNQNLTVSGMKRVYSNP